MSHYLFEIAAVQAGIAVPSWKSRLQALILRFASTSSAQAEYARKETTFRLILKEYDDMIGRICFGYSRNNSELQDLRQDCYAAIWQSLDRFREEAQLKTWIYRVSLNTCVSTLRHRSKEPLKSTIDDFKDIIDTDSEHLSRLNEMHDLIAMLPPIEKAIILMWLDEMSYDKIAEVVGIPRNTVATKLRRAKEKLTNII